jgi:hypothetical protein
MSKEQYGITLIAPVHSSSIWNLTDLVCISSIYSLITIVTFTRPCRRGERAKTTLINADPAMGREDIKNESPESRIIQHDTLEEDEPIEITELPPLV